jgi:hypothetical protein
MYNAIAIEYGNEIIPSKNNKLERRYLYAKLANGAVYKWNSIVDMNSDTHTRLVRQYIAQRQNESSKGVKRVTINPKFWTKVS